MRPRYLGPAGFVLRCMGRKLRVTLSLAALALCLLGVLVAAQQPFRVYYAMEGPDTEAPIPPDYQDKTEFVLGRLMYPSRGDRGGAWTQGGSNWTVDYPKGDRFFARALRRLTRVDVRSVEQPVNPDDEDDIFHWPYLHAAMVGHWDLTDAQAAKIREYLLRGGFMICDSFFGTQEWAGFEAGMKRIFPDRPIVDIEDDHPIFHVVYRISKRYQVGNWRSMVRDGHPYRADGSVPAWRGILDDRGRVMVVMNFNNDLADSWQHADNPRYPQEYSDLGLRLGVNYVVYAMTH